MSIAKGLHNALLAGESIGCTAIQLFTHSNRQWAIKPLSDNEIQLFNETRKKTAIQEIVVHASYLINIGSPDVEIYNKSYNMLIQELKRCEQLSIPLLILHPGSHRNSTPEKSILQISLTLDKVLEQIPGKSMILLEIMAGQGSSIGSTFEELAAIRKAAIHKNRIGFCFDTCHAFAAGYSFQTSSEYSHLLNTIDQIIGINHIKAFHLNDSQKPCSSHVDRHEHIGKGKLGLEPFRLILNDPRFALIPKILETPHNETLTDDIHNLATLRSLIK